MPWFEARRTGEVGWKRSAEGCWRMARNSSRASDGVDLWRDDERALKQADMWGVWRIGKGG